MNYLRMLLVFIAIGIGAASAAAEEDEAWQKEARLIGRVLYLLEAEYIDELDIKECAIRFLVGFEKKERGGYLGCTLDEHSHFLTPEKVREFLRDIDGTVTGIGIQVREQDGTVIISHILSGGPADRAGLRVEDVLRSGSVALGARQHPFFSREQVATFLGVNPGTRVWLTVERDSAVLRQWVMRERIEFRTVFPHTVSIGDEHFSYIAVKSFGSRTATEFAEVMRGARVGAESDISPGAIIDLRGNPGGGIETVMEMLYGFASSPDDTLASTRKRRGGIIRRTVEFPLGFAQNPTTGRLESAGGFRMPDGTPRVHGEWSDMPIVILVDRDSASGAELFAGTMQDWAHVYSRPVVVVGEITAGKGVGQNGYPIPGHGVLLLTAFEYLVGNSQRSIRNKGVIPDTVVGSTPMEERPAPWDAPNPETDPPLKKALEILRGLSSLSSPAVHETP